MYDVNYFPEPDAYNFVATSVPLDWIAQENGQVKGTACFFQMHLKWGKVMRAVTDAGPIKQDRGKSEPVNNLFTIEYLSLNRKHLNILKTNMPLRDPLWRYEEATGRGYYSVHTEPIHIKNIDILADNNPFPRLFQWRRKGKSKRLKTREEVEK